MDDMREKILIWFATGGVGASSKAMACAVLGLQNDGYVPADPSDLNRCLLLLDSVPEIRNHMDKVAAISDTWERLVAKWDEVEQCFLEEVGLNWINGGHATKTYELMKKIGC
jgi:hypothetical protein